MHLADKKRKIFFLQAGGDQRAKRVVNIRFFQVAGNTTPNEC